MDWPGDLMDMLRGAYGAWGYPIILAGALLENTALLGLVLPGGSLVLLGAVYAQQGVLSLPLVVLCGWIGMTLGASADFALGGWGVRSPLWRTRWQARLEPKLAEARRFLARHGAWALLLAHFIGHVRSFVAITAGMSGLPYRRFLFYEAIAALIWNLVWVLTGYLVGTNLGVLQRFAGGASLIMLPAAAIGYLIYRRLRRKTSRRAMSAPSGADAHP
jgi:membrane protein DedA with SNARE-associated domain